MGGKGSTGGFGKAIPASSGTLRDRSRLKCEMVGRTEDRDQTSCGDCGLGSYGRWKIGDGADYPSRFTRLRAGAAEFAARIIPPLSEGTAPQRGTNPHRAIPLADRVVPRAGTRASRFAHPSVCHRFLRSDYPPEQTRGTGSFLEDW